MVAFVVVRSVPTKLFRWDAHGLRNGVALLLQQVLPCGCFVITKALRILPPQGENEGPHLSVVSLQFILCRLEIRDIFCTE